MARSVARTRRAFAPGHVTGVFRPDATGLDPRARGSVGAGVVLELGATAVARFEPGARTSLTVSAPGLGPLPISEEVARRLRPLEPGRLAVRLFHSLPVGQGFGMSAAGAVATGLAVADLARRSRAEAIQVAHLADLFGGGGLGGVASILGGGLEVRLRPGIPPLGEVRHRAFAPSLFIGVVGPPIPSANVLGNTRALRRIAMASEGWAMLERRPDVTTFFDVAERFTDRAGLASPAVRRAVRALRARGGRACQAMFGESFFAYAPDGRARVDCLRWLERREIPTIELRSPSRGARLVP